MSMIAWSWSFAGRSRARSRPSPTIWCCARQGGLRPCAGCPAAVRITLEKRLPVAAGLGGGSADAAAVLRGLNRLWRLGMVPADLAALAAGLGADVPVCLAGRTARMQGVGEQVEPWDGLPPLAVLLVNPNLPLATAAVFGALEAIGERVGAGLAAAPRARTPSWHGCARAPTTWRRRRRACCRRSATC